jgi:methionyl-tRNA formyltransferase
MSASRLPLAHGVYVYLARDGSPPAARLFVADCASLALDLGFRLVDEPRSAMVAIAPLLARKIGPEEWGAPVLGTLIFHPSALPRHRGPDAIRHTLAAREHVSAATWFWCDHGLDTGPVCEQDVVVLDPDEKPRDAYARRFVPAGLRALRRALAGILEGAPRRAAQEDRLATYETFMPKDKEGRAA